MGAGLCSATVPVGGGVRVFGVAEAVVVELDIQVIAPVQPAAAQLLHHTVSVSSSGLSVPPPSVSVWASAALAGNSRLAARVTRRTAFFLFRLFAR